jgi:hypothetical protein
MLGLSCTQREQTPSPAKKDGASRPATQPAAATRKVDSHAEPFVALVRAVKTSDIQLLKTVWSKSMTSHVKPAEADEYWKSTLKTYQEGFATELGEYTVDDFTVTFTGEDTRGRLNVSFKGKDLPALRIIKEGDSWKLDER